MLTKQRKQKTGLFITLGVLAIMIIGFLIFFWMKGKTSGPLEEEDLSGRELASHTIAYEDTGLVKLYDLKTEKEIDEFDLVSLSKVETTEEEVVVREKVEKKEKPKKEKNETYKNFDQIRITVIKHDNAWNIQRALTPSRNTTEMLSYVRDLNDGYAMHPIYPGEEYIFLKEKGDNDIDEEDIGIVIEEVIEAEPEYIERVEIKVTEKKEDSYIYYKDFENGILYAHSDFNNEVYSISVSEEAKLKVEKHLKHESIGEPSQFIVNDNDIFFGYEKEKIIYHLHDGKIEKVQLPGIPTNWLATKSELVYTYDDFISSYDLKDKEHQTELLGDETKDLLLHKDAAYVLSKFGEDSENNLLMKVDPSTLLVEDLIELKTNDTAIVSHGDGEFLWVSGIEKLGSKTTKETKEPIIYAFTSEPFKSDKKKNWKISSFIQEGQVFDAHIYTKEAEHLKVYKERTEEEVLSLKINSDNFLVIKKPKNK